jgi:hypothetical protein
MFKGEKRARAVDAKAASKSGDASRPNSGNGSASKAAEYEITLFNKTDGPLTKCIRLTDDDSVFSDGSACVMARGQHGASGSATSVTSRHLLPRAAFRNGQHALTGRHDRYARGDASQRGTPLSGCLARAAVSEQKPDNLASPEDSSAPRRRLNSDGGFGTGERCGLDDCPSTTASGRWRPAWISAPGWCPAKRRPGVAALHHGSDRFRRHR